MKPEDLPKLEALIRALNVLQSSDIDLDREAREAGAAAIFEKAEALKKGGGRNRRKIHYCNTPQFNVALQYVVGDLTYPQAIEHLCELCACEQRTAQKHLAEMKPRAENTVAGITRLKLMAHRQANPRRTK